MCNATQRQAHVGKSAAFFGGLSLCTLLASAGTVSVPEDALRPLQPYVPAETSSLIDMFGLSDVARFEQAVPVEMRDGTWLSADLIIPRDAGERSKRPAILIKTPYDKSLTAEPGLQRDVMARLVRAGYVLAVVNDRGTQWSEGRYHWLSGANADAYDTLTWMSRRSWSNGRIGTYGCSSPGEYQLGLASMNHPAHKAAVIMAAATGFGVIPGFSDQGIFYRGGIPSLDWAWWYRTFAFYAHPVLPRSLSQQERSQAAAFFKSSPSRIIAPSAGLDWVSHLPSAEVLSADGSPQTEFEKLIRMSPTDPGWKNYDFVNQGNSTSVPSLHIDSWYDALEIYGTMRGFEYLSSNSPNQNLIVGPTAHCMQGSETEDTWVGDRPVGDARFPYADRIVSFFDHWLKPEEHRSFDLPRIQYYLLSGSQWHTSTAWPPPGGHSASLYLHSKGRANSLLGDGELTATAPAADEPADRFVYDPLNPVPTRGGGCCEPAVALDQRPVELRNDVLVYSSAPLEKDLDVVGYVKAELHFESSAPDTDLMLKLVDVYPDGRAFNLGDSALRLRYREGRSNPTRMKAGEVYKVSLEGIVTANRFKAGHRIRIEIASSNFPGLERNLNSSGANHDESVAHVAVNGVHHSPRYPSMIIFTTR